MSKQHEPCPTCGQGVLLGRMVRTQVYLVPAVHDELRQVAFQRGTTMADLIRRAIDAWRKEQAAKSE